MTATRKWTVGAALVALLILAAGWFMLISPKRAEVSDLQAQAQSQLDENSRLETEKAVLEQEFKNLPEKQAELAALQTKLPESQDLASYIRELQTLGDRSGVTLTSMTPATPVTVGGGAITATDPSALMPDSLAALNVDIVVSGGWDNVRDFVNEMEGTERYTLVSGLNIAEVDDEESVPANELTATLNARIYLVPTGEATGVTDEPIPGVEASTAPTTPAP